MGAYRQQHVISPVFFLLFSRCTPSPPRISPFYNHYTLASLIYILKKRAWQYILTCHSWSTQRPIIYCALKASGFLYSRPHIGARLVSLCLYVIPPFQRIARVHQRAGAAFGVKMEHYVRNGGNVS